MFHIKAPVQQNHNIDSYFTNDKIDLSKHEVWVNVMALLYCCLEMNLKNGEAGNVNKPAFHTPMKR